MHRLPLKIAERMRATVIRELSVILEAVEKNKGSELRAVGLGDSR